MTADLDLDGQQVVAVVRTRDATTAEAIADAVVAGGIRAVEITATVPDAARVLAGLRERHDDHVLLGGGTVTTPAVATAFLEAGADFLMSPTFDAAVLDAAVAADIAYVPGVLTPTEAARAFGYGLTTLKLFPATSVGIPHLRALRSVLPTVRILPTGGVGIDDAAAWLAAGAPAVGIGSTFDRAYARGGRPEVEGTATAVLDRIRASEQSAWEKTR